jgi:hypothetical protein
LVVGRRSGSGSSCSGRSIVARHLGRVHAAEAGLAAGREAGRACARRALRTHTVRAAGAAETELEKLRLLLLLHNTDLLLHQVRLLLGAERRVLLRVHVLRREALGDEVRRRRAETGHLKRRREAVAVEA